MRNKIVAIGAAAILVGGAVLYAVNQKPQPSQVESLVMLQTFENPQFLRGIGMMASSVAQAMGKEDLSRQIEKDLRAHPEFNEMKKTLISGFGEAIESADIGEQEIEQIIAFYKSSAGEKWTVAVGNPNVVLGFQSLFSLVQKVVSEYPEESTTQLEESEELDLAEAKPREAVGLQSVSEGEFRREVIESTRPVLVDMYADWCGPCRAMMPIVEDLAQELEGIKVVKINIDNASSLTREYKVTGIPTFLFFKNGELKGKVSGKYSKEQLKKEIDRYLK
jgi:thioredoxin 1